jgi:Ni,Fe-hydrogenase III small subunit
MSNWPLRSLVHGIRTTAWPRREERSPGVGPGRPRADAQSPLAIAEHCPTNALQATAGGVGVDFGRCVHCQRCRRGDGALPWSADFAWTAPGPRPAAPLGQRFRRSLHVRYIDAGACGACMGEVRLIDAPPYNLHRFGIFVTASPRDADVLLVGGPVTAAMRTPVLKAYTAMPEPKRVVAMGVCAINGGIFGKSFASDGGLAGVVPVNLVIPGCPPPPLAILHALLAVTGRAETRELKELP